MARTLYDAITPENIPADAEIVASYVDALAFTPRYGDLERLFPHAIRLGISTAGADAHILDYEPSNWGYYDGPHDDQVIAWVQRQRARGLQHPWVYCNETNDWQRVRAAFQAAGVAEPLWWCANYDRAPGLLPGQIAHQYASNKGYDSSVVADFIPGVDSPDPAPAHVEDFVFELVQPSGQPVYLHGPGVWHHVADPDELAAWKRCPLVKLADTPTGVRSCSAWDGAQYAAAARDMVDARLTYFLPRIAATLRFGTANAAFNADNAGPVLVDAKGLKGDAAAAAAQVAQAVADVPANVAAALPAGADTATITKAVTDAINALELAVTLAGTARTGAQQ